MFYEAARERPEVEKGGIARILHEKKMAKTFQAFKIRLSDNSKKGIRRDRLYPRSRSNFQDLNTARHSRAGGNPEIKSGFRSSIRRS